ncbi:ferrous-iron efflux pump FieF [Variibacter gotjawalensis]|uniref:Protein p34 n=1 Tax=Variibacter gotjawalensis TaxID=1333996 RepID=A0A0S3PYQ6_9BRAD|nr:cation diffusion facilitator family transporter [Variibacter gotjawalensis]NIK46917.1 cation diffusion facilitator family transporter [Variibacter gotjawalensis]RZS48821.1 cation diffusion facilitator family transporter [Variibacter gotjawalensis]BAT61080.1 ferrous-iron efflux pump FieF [Variibacter gotjawalensis]
MQSSPAFERLQVIATISIAVGVVVLGLKYLAYHLTGSVALLSDAIESIVNVATAVITLLAIRWASKPPDADHPWGHNKVEYFSAVVEGVLIVIAALAILREAYGAYQAPHLLEQPWQGIAVNALASAINAAWATVLMRQGRAQRSPALAADGRHLFTDVVSSVGVLAGVILAALTGWALLDPALAALVAVNILWSGWRLVKESVGGLLDEALPSEQLTRIRAIIAANAEGAIEAHDVRTRHAGRTTFVDFHLVVPGDLSVTRAHDICDRIEQAIKAEVAGASISIHVEPDDKAKHSGIVVL